MQEKIEKNINKTIDAEIKYQKRFDTSFYFTPLKLEDREIYILNSVLETDELEMFGQILDSHAVGSTMLVIIGLRSLIERLVNKICIKK